ncbi:hypothetical protein Ptr902_03818 [Pyrenophora tritici-repentis]|uniref:Uncharacterized protein n=1 Tax=Pyrenophora tritici-repentis TaxID=45151 RepID=A0A5M9LEW9_9PLEO|nr:hypothetical protein PtrV1_07647 [Pyrenophora tritici-repentis]KAF7448702.1 hypothetical protein A1F99_080660 [Pyrenophora tritici-repentis]KAF7572424.1 hypothetical protein PtrM4_099240 [Pyrenophora tritici-repentis]KAI0571112.1 hypothetical protein Alg215_10608 [Pyrenophora tritici-repentis]KAI2484878.1 hypothetical protein Ptr902_03818 [Pyrenophora tritici-repentis]
MLSIMNPRSLLVFALMSLAHCQDYSITSPLNPWFNQECCASALEKCQRGLPSEFKIGCVKNGFYMQQFCTLAPDAECKALCERTGGVAVNTKQGCMCTVSNPYKGAECK